MRRKLLTAVLVLALAAIGGPRALDALDDGDGNRDPASGNAGGERVVRVERVVDGDTIVVSGGERVRYIGMDTPESVEPGTPVQCFAEAAAARNRALVAGRRVRLVADAEPRDRYGRTLAYVYRASDGVFVNAALVREGYARTLTIPPNVAHADEFARLSTNARKYGRGLWSQC